MYQVIFIAILVFIIYYLFNNSLNNSNDIIYVFFEKNNVLSQELEKEWIKVNEYLLSKKIRYKKIYLDDPIYTEWRNNYNIKSAPEIIKVRCDGFRIKYNGKRLSENIIAWVFENKK